MTQEVYLGGAWRTVDTGEVYLFGAWRRLTYAEAYRDGTWVNLATYTSPVSVSVSPDSASGMAASASPTGVGTNRVTATGSGGLPPYSYAWTLQVNDGGTASTATSPSMAGTSFAKANVPDGTIYNDVWRVTVTDSLGSTAFADITATFSNFSGGFIP